tara:strand:- start:2469 stop:2861 length:393 start_codon:yes stop_codon:yes gene_type:complete
MSQIGRFAGEWVLPILAGVGTGTLAAKAVKSTRTPDTGGGWEGESPEDRKMINGLQKLMVDGVIDGRQVNQLIKSGQLSDRVIFLLGDIHEPLMTRNMEPGEDPAELLQILRNAERNAGYEAYKDKLPNS